MRLTFNEYYDKVLGCYIGKNIGGTLGAPFECYRGQYNVKWFVQDISKPIPNDDIDLQLVWLRAAELEGRKIDSHVLAEYWNTYISATLSEYGTGKNNFNAGIMPPLSGHMRNVNRNSNGAWIRTEIWACLCAGNPSLAANYAYYDSSVDHSGEGVYAAVFCAAMQSAAFFESDIFKLIEIARSYIPQDCAVLKAVDCVIDSYKSKLSRKEARKRLFNATPSSFGMLGGYWKGTMEVPASESCPVQEEETDIPKAEHGFDAPWSVGAIILGLLYGSDFGDALCTTVNLGEDTDCTAGAVGSILGIIHGASGLPKEWKEACSNEISTWTLRIDQNLRLPKTIEELAYRIARLAPSFLMPYNCNILPGFDYSKGIDGVSQSFFEIYPVKNLAYTPRAFEPFWQEDTRELVSEQKSVVRRHFMLYNVLIKFDEDLAKIEEGKPKSLEITFLNMLFDPQYLKVRFIDVPEDWEFKPKEVMVGLEHWHGSYNNNTFTCEFTPKNLTKGRYTIIMEIVSEGRATRNYIPLTFLNGPIIF